MSSLVHTKPTSASTSAFRLSVKFGMHSCKTRKLVTSIERCEVLGVPAFRHLVLVFVILVVGSDSAHAPEFQNIFGPPRVVDPPPVVSVPEEELERARMGSRIALEALSKTLYAISQREGGVDQKTYEQTMQTALTQLADSATNMSEIAFSSEYDLKFVSAVQGIDDTRRELRFLLGELDIDIGELDRVSDLAVISAEATHRIRILLEEVYRMDRQVPIFPIVEPKLSVYLELGALVSRIGEATYTR